MYHREKSESCNHIANKLKKYGILTDMQSGKISYSGNQSVNLYCKNLYFLRHGETEGTTSHRFMSAFSPNSCLTEKGRQQLLHVANKISQIDIDHILFSSIPRVKQTAEIIRQNINQGYDFTELSWLIGIDNTGWEGKTPKELDGIDAEDFIEREKKHNIFARSVRGSSWGQVLLCSITLINYLNEHFSGKNVLLISQGSILMGFQLLLHIHDEPWKKYDTDDFFCLKNNGQSTNYGKLKLIYHN